MCPLNKLRREHKINTSSVNWSRNGSVRLSDFGEIDRRNLQVQVQGGKNNRLRHVPYHIWISFLHQQEMLIFDRLGFDGKWHEPL